MIHTENGEQNNEQDNKLLTTNFEVKVENRKVKGLITYSADQQILKFKVNSGTTQELWGFYIDFQSIHNKWTIGAILQHMGYYATTENPNVMMRENHSTQSPGYIIIYEDELYIVSITPEEILHMLKDKYKINIIFKINIHMILVEDVFVNVKSSNILKSYMSMLRCISTTNFLQIYIFHSKSSSNRSKKESQLGTQPKYM